MAIVNALAKIKQINSDHKNEIEELKQNFHQIIDEKVRQLENENAFPKQIINQKMKKLFC
uniref:Uncharacterized protein n=1 Tax=Meloidogyne enterolobii TaxID=390850 RepID=A0A6V7WL07_MELEN|nr:unnamed protein product [Meloidogyne enterolobii]